ncbi:hypothetical protein Gotur_021483, partial [Gossypium turneri]
MQYPEYACSSITVNRELPAGSGFLARGDARPGMQVGPKLISALIERWRPETHTVHLPCGECTITLEYVSLQLGLPVDGHPVTGSAQSSNWEAVCYELLGAIPDKMNGGKVEKGWLRDTFPDPNENSTEIERIR